MILHLLFASLGSILQLVSMIIFVTDQAGTNDTLQVVTIWLAGVHYLSSCFMIYIVYKLSELKDSQQDDPSEATETEDESNEATEIGEERDVALIDDIQLPSLAQARLIQS